MSSQIEFLMEITGGDNKFELFRQLQFVGLKDDEGHAVKKSLNLRGRRDRLIGKSHGKSTDVPVQVTEIGAKDDGGDLWLIAGFCGELPQIEPLTRGLRGGFEGSYNTHTRSGLIRIWYRMPD